MTYGLYTDSACKYEYEGLDVDVDTVTDIEDLHQQALNSGSKTYIDPATGFTVFTELCHLQRGFCCGNSCRHCPYGYENVKKNSIRKQAKVQSGDIETTQKMVQDILKLSTSNRKSTKANATPSKTLNAATTTSSSPTKISSAG